MSVIIQSITLTAQIPSGSVLPMQDYTAYAGNAIQLVFSILDASGSPIDIVGSGATVRYKVRQITGADIWTGGKACTMSAIAGQVNVCTLILAGTDTAALSGKYSHILEIIDSATNPTTVMLGSPTFIAGSV